MQRYKTVEEYIDNSEWKSELELLRKIILELPYEETVKWGMPVYTVNGKNVAGISGFKSHAGIWFFQGALLADTHKKLINAQEGTTKAMRQWRFSSAREIDDSIQEIREYLEEALENQKMGREIKADRGKPLTIPAELQAALNSNPNLKNSFEQLSLGKKRDYAEYIETAKQDATKDKRLEKITPMILEGIGLNDKYKK